MPICHKGIMRSVSQPRVRWRVAVVRAALALYLALLARFTLWPKSSQQSVWKRINAGSEAASAGRVDFHYAEMLANIALFLPFGVLAVLAFRRVPVLAASAALSGAIEIAQVSWLPSRDGTLRDVALNVIGAVVGAGVARVSLRAGGSSPRRTASLRVDRLKRSDVRRREISRLRASEAAVPLDPIEKTQPNKRGSQRHRRAEAPVTGEHHRYQKRDRADASRDRRSGCGPDQRDRGAGQHHHE